MMQFTIQKYYCKGLHRLWGRNADVFDVKDHNDGSDLFCLDANSLSIIFFYAIIDFGGGISSAGAGSTASAQLCRFDDRADVQLLPAL